MSVVNPYTGPIKSLADVPEPPETVNLCVNPVVGLKLMQQLMAVDLGKNPQTLPRDHRRGAAAGGRRSGSKRGQEGVAARRPTGSCLSSVLTHRVSAGATRNVFIQPGN